MTRKIVITSSIFMLILLFANMVFQAVSLIDIEKSKQSGNNRWKQVENRIINMEERIENLENIENIRRN